MNFRHQINMNDGSIKSRGSSIFNADRDDQSPKGLQNMPGENSCFLNSAVQVLWHLDAFRRNFRLISTHYCHGQEYCIFCALKVLFTQFQFSDLSILVNDTLRKALANVFTNTQRYQLGHMDDAAECFENILQRLHFHTVQPHLCTQELCHAKHCIAHCKFAMLISEQIICQCGGHTQLPEYMQLVQYVSVTELVKQSFEMRKQGVVSDVNMFGQLLYKASTTGDVRDCPRNCGSYIQIRRTLLNEPEVVSIGLVWDSERADLCTLEEMTKIIAPTIRLADLFHFVRIDDESVANEHLTLFGVVCYYGKHYSTFVWNDKLNSWIYFDDARWRQIGHQWSDAALRIAECHYQPLLLLYTRNNPSLIDASGALVQTEAAPYKIVPTFTSNQRSLRNSRTILATNDEGLLGGNPYLNSLLEHEANPASAKEYINTNVVKAVLQQRQCQRLSFQRHKNAMLLTKPSVCLSSASSPNITNISSIVSTKQNSLPPSQHIDNQDHETNSQLKDCPELSSFEMMGFRQQYDDLCIKASLLLQRSQQLEMNHDPNMALFHLTQATICYKQAMEIPYIGSDSRKEAKASYFECQQRCRIVHATLRNSHKDSGLSTWSETNDLVSSVESHRLSNNIKKNTSQKPDPPQRTTSIKNLNMELESTSSLRITDNKVQSYCTLPRGKAAKQRQIEKQQVNQQRFREANGSTEALDDSAKLVTMLDTVGSFESSEAVSLSARRYYYQQVREKFHSKCYNEWPVVSTGEHEHSSCEIDSSSTSSSTQQVFHSPPFISMEHDSGYVNQQSTETIQRPQLQPASSQANVDHFKKPASPYKQQKCFAIGATRPDKLSVLKKRKTRIDSVASLTEDYSNDQSLCSMLSNNRRMESLLVSASCTPRPATVNKCLNGSRPIITTSFNTESSTPEEAVLCHLCLKKTTLEMGALYCYNCLNYLRHSFVVNNKTSS